MSDLVFIFPVSITVPGDDDSTFVGHILRGSYNPGVDLPTGVGFDCWAPCAMVITEASNSFGGSGGRYVRAVALNPDGSRSRWQFLFLHLDATLCSVGQVIERGQLFALTGSSANGRARGGVGAHLHFTILLDGQQVDPMLYLVKTVTPADPDQEEENSMALSEHALMQIGGVIDVKLSDFDKVIEAKLTEHIDALTRRMQRESRARLYRNSDTGERIAIGEEFEGGFERITLGTDDGRGHINSLRDKQLVGDTIEQSREYGEVAFASLLADAGIPRH